MDSHSRAFRQDINGLRALAVLVVVLFHAGVPGFGGGFIGVDVFFVISGYLMTRIIMGRLGQGRFSVLGFWAARVRRTVPALVVLCAVLAVAGWWLIDPLTYADLGREATAALLFWSNLLFWRDSGYFDAAASTKWLLHTWSLAVEWQFYLAFPLVLLAIHRMAGPRVVAPLLWLGFLLSLLLSGVATSWRPAIAFYWLPPRAWEMMAGGLVLVHAPTLARVTALGRRGLEIAGLATLVLALTLVHADTPWPSFWALLPVVGTALVIAADRGTASLLNARAAQGLGVRSYSIYLWHWPVIVAARYFGYAGTPWAAPVAIALGLGLGALSFALVERRMPQWLERAASPRAITAGVAGAAALLMWASATVQTSGFLTRAPDPRMMARLSAARDDWVFPVSACQRVGADGSDHRCVVGRGDDTLVIGDSHADQWFARAVDRGGDVTFITRDGCAPLPGVRLRGLDCADFYRLAMTAAAQGPFRRIVLTAFWQSYLRPGAFADGVCIIDGPECVAPDTHPAAVAAVFSAFARDLARLGPGRQIVIVLPDLEPPGNLPVELAKAAFFGRDPAPLLGAPLAAVRAATADTREALLRVAAVVGADTVDPLQALCGPAACRFVDENGQPLFRDNNHLRSSVVRSRLSLLDPYFGHPAAVAAADPATGLKPALP